MNLYWLNVPSTQHLLQKGKIKATEALFTKIEETRSAAGSNEISVVGVHFCGRRTVVVQLKRGNSAQDNSNNTVSAMIWSKTSASVQLSVVSKSIRWVRKLTATNSNNA